MDYNDDVYDFLHNNVVFRGIPDQDLFSLMDLIYQKHYKAGDYIAHEGDIAEHFFIVYEGSVQILKEQTGDGESHIIATIQTSETIGEFSLIENSPHAARSASIKAAEDTILLVFNNDDLHSDKLDIHIYNALIVNLAQLVCRRLRMSNEQKAQKNAS